MKEFESIGQVHNGARFYNADLHIHSYGASHDVKDKAMTPEGIVDSAAKQGLGVIGLTDHNSDANVQRALVHAQRHAGRLLVLPGVEVTTAHGHLLVYFAPERAADLSKFLSRLDLIGPMGGENTRTAKSMADTIAEAAKLGGMCIAAHIDRSKTGFEVFAPGFQNWKRDIITSQGLYGVECDTIEALKWYSEQDEAEPPGVERRKMLAARKEVAQLSARHHLAHVQGSDSHSMQQFEHRDPLKAWTRIKLTEFSFAALRVAFVDPTARVRARASVPVAMPRIRGVAMTGGFLNGEVIHLSDNLNCFIGGRGTGKSTAIRAIAYAFGLNDEFGDYENCPDSVCVFCEDANGVLYRYIRTRGGDTEVTAHANGAQDDVPIDSFRIEYFGQGELATVAKDPLNTPELFQAFLDRHTSLRDLIETEQALVTRLRENAGRLNPIESAFAQLDAKRKSLTEVEKKLKVAEEGNLREVVGTQSKLASEKTVRESVEAIAVAYSTGFSLATIQRSFDQILATAGTCTSDPASKKAIDGMKRTLAASNADVKKKEVELNSILKQYAQALTQLVGELKASHQRISGEVVGTLADLKARGIATDIPGLEALLRQKTSIAREIAAVEQRAQELTECRKEREQLREELRKIREMMTERRKAQLKGINVNLGLIMPNLDAPTGPQQNRWSSKTPQVHTASPLGRSRWN